MRFIDLFAGLGGFHYALRDLGHECVFASEINPDLRALYRENFHMSDRSVVGDIRLEESKALIPPHEILCAGFPCQPFSKSGDQRGLEDETRGTLFHEILEIVRCHEPVFVLLENVGNFARHDRGRTWRIVRESLEERGYRVIGTEHIRSGGHGLVSPHHLGYPHHRERFFIVATREPLAVDPFPPRETGLALSLEGIVQAPEKLTVLDREETALTDRQLECVDHWNEFLAAVPSRISLPSFPIWGDEIEASYPFEDCTPATLPIEELRLHANGIQPVAPAATKGELLDRLPSYARQPQAKFPDWKVRFIAKNREFFEQVRPYLEETWIERLFEFPASLRKLEWNCQGEVRDLWRHVLQFRPSGLRAKRYDSVPALVAMTTTQVPVLGPERRFLTRIEGLRLQGFPDEHRLPESRAAAFAALGNAVHTGVVREIADRVCLQIVSNGKSMSGNLS